VKLVTSRHLWIFALALAAAVASMLIAPGTATAESGGACETGQPVDSCIGYDALQGNVVTYSYYHGMPPSQCARATSLYSSTGERVAYQTWNKCDAGWNPGLTYSTGSGTFRAYTCFQRVPPGPWILLGCTYSPSLHVPPEQTHR